MKKIDKWKKQVKSIASIEGIRLPVLPKKGYTDMYKQGMTPVQAVAYVQARGAKPMIRLHIREEERKSSFSKIKCTKAVVERLIGKKKVATAIKDPKAKELDGIVFQVMKDLKVEISIL